MHVSLPLIVLDNEQHLHIIVTYFMLLLIKGYISLICQSYVKQVAQPYCNKSVCVCLYDIKRVLLKHLSTPLNSSSSRYKMSHLTGAGLLSNGCVQRFHAFFLGQNNLV